MELQLNSDHSLVPAKCELFCDSGSVAHVLYGAVAGSDVVSAKGALIMLALFVGYQITQLQAGASWTRTGGELLEFGIGMLGGMALEGRA